MDELNFCNSVLFSFLHRWVWSRRDTQLIYGLLLKIVPLLSHTNEIDPHSSKSKKIPFGKPLLVKASVCFLVSQFGKGQGHRTCVCIPNFTVSHLKRYSSTKSSPVFETLFQNLFFLFFIGPLNSITHN